MYKKFSYAGLLALVLAAPALAQFEVSPDHFDGPTHTTPQKAQHAKSVARKTAAHKSQSAQAKKPSVAPQHKTERVIAKK